MTPTVAQSPEAMGHDAQGNGLAEPWRAGDEREATLVNLVFHAVDEMLELGRNEERFGGHVWSEGIPFEAVQRLEFLGRHRFVVSLSLS
jgi:hypothetical protein